MKQQVFVTVTSHFSGFLDCHGPKLGRPDAYYYYYYYYYYYERNALGHIKLSNTGPLHLLHVQCMKYVGSLHQLPLPVISE